MSLTDTFKKTVKDSINESSRMSYQDFMMRIKEYMSRKNIDNNSGISQNEMRKAYDEGKYPSEFIKNYLKNQ